MDSCILTQFVFRESFKIYATFLQSCYFYSQHCMITHLLLFACKLKKLKKHLTDAKIKTLHHKYQLEMLQCRCMNSTL